MPTKSPQLPFSPGAALLAALDTNNRITAYLVEALPVEAWRAETLDGKGRNVAEIVAHIHNVRLMWLKATGAPTLPDQLDRITVTPTQALVALGQSHRALRDIIASGIEGDGKVKGFKPDVVGFAGYLIAHEAHHRGQVTVLARQAGHPIPQNAMFGMWEWGSRGKEIQPY